MAPPPPPSGMNPGFVPDYSFASQLIRQKVGENSFDVGYKNQRLPTKWVEPEVEPEVKYSQYLYFEKVRKKKKRF